jgi:hypothetical protein
MFFINQLNPKKVGTFFASLKVVFHLFEKPMCQVGACI